MSRPLIAVVDDEPSIRKALTRLLRVADYGAEGFASPADFLEWLTDHRPACVVIDLQMPEMTGAELQQQLLQRSDPPPVIIITAHDEPQTRERCLALGAVRYLRKPITRDVLLESIEETISAGRRPTRAPRDDLG
jgi:FixJ family two-component response regulator